MIQYGRQSIDDSDIAAVVAALNGDFLTTGPLVEKFEKGLESVVGAPTVSVTSGTAALHCAYAAVGIKPGDEVITPPITFIATQATAALMGAKIVFVDVQPDTANIDPNAVEAAISERTKAIVAVDYAGHPADLDELKTIAEKHGIYLIEDAAHSIGSTYKNRPVGSIADITTFSFFPTKNLTTAEGGAVSSTNPDLLERARKFSKQGLVRDPSQFLVKHEGPWHQEVHEFGLNYRLPDVLSALGISQLNRLASFKKRRREIFEYYTNAFRDFELIRTPTEKTFIDSNWHLFPIRVPAVHRANIFELLRSKGIGAQVNYLPAHLHPVFNSHGFKRGDFPISEAFYESEISLPIHFELTESDLFRVTETLRSFDYE
jgi:UDP-4-amino-4,6-dideoxy-N-acetyl-beta-L-altrosamine transaminase